MQHESRGWSEKLEMKAPPYSYVEPVTDTLFGVPVPDPYRWLEDQNSQRTRGWLEDQAMHSRVYFNGIPGRETIRGRVEELLAIETISEPWRVGDRYFYLKRAAYKDQPSIAMREGELGEEIVLVDPADVDKSPATAVRILGISSDANLLAYSVRNGGQDSCSLRFFDVRAREQLSDGLPPGFFQGLAFSPDNNGFYYSHEVTGTKRPTYRAIFWHAFGTDHREDTVTFFGGEDPRLRIILLSSCSGRWLGYYKLFTSSPWTSEFWLHEVASGAAPQEIVKRLEGLFVPFVLDDGLLALTDWKTPNRHVVKIDINHPEPENWQDIVPESDSRIESVAVAGGFVFVTRVRDLSTSVEVFDFTGAKHGAVPLPSKGTASIFPCRADGNTIFLRFTSFIDPPVIFRLDVRTSSQQLWARSAVKFDRSSVEVERVQYLSKDGTSVPMFLVSRKDSRVDGPLPTFLTAYGGFGNSVTPQFTAYATYLLERGCLFAVANVRGGAEFGEAWHIAAKRLKRQTAIDDFLAAAEWLVGQGLAAPDRLGIGGGSNAGLLVGAALAQKPHLFRAVICLGPLLDMLRYHLFDFASSWVDEYGSAENETDFQALLRFSPYHRVAEGVAYPAVLLISGDADTRCNPMHARKMAAKLQASTTSKHPIVLDYRSEWGHMPVQPLTRRINALTDRLAFLCHELGLDVPRE